MAYTQEQIDALKAMKAKGLVKGQMGNESVEFISPDDLQRTIDRMQAEVNGTRVSRLRQTTPVLKRGL